VLKYLIFSNNTCHVSTLFVFKFLNFFNFKQIIHISTHNCVTCQCQCHVSVCNFIIIIFVQFSLYIRYFLIQFLYSLFLFNLVTNFVKIEQFCPFQIETNFFYKYYIFIFKIDIIINYF